VLRFITQGGEVSRIVNEINESTKRTAVLVELSIDKNDT
jgi:hypothetical protein